MKATSVHGCSACAGVQAARSCIEELRSEAGKTGDAAAVLRSLQQDPSSISRNGKDVARGSKWVPKQGEDVQVPKMGGSIGQVSLAWLCVYRKCIHHVRLAAILQLRSEARGGRCSM